MGEITELFSRRNKNRTDYPMFSVTNARGFVNQQEQFEDREMKGEDIAAYKIVSPGEFAYNPSRINVGSIARYDGETDCMISSLYVCFKANKENVDSQLLLHILKSPKMVYNYGINGEGGVRIYLFYPNFARIRVKLPSIEEQRKIASFLDLIEERIQIQNKVIEDCITLEKEIQNQVFGQISAPLVPLSSISQRVTERNTSLESDNVLTISAREGLVSQLEFFNKSVASENLSNYYLLRNGDFAYNKSYSSDHPWGAIKHLEKYDTGVLSPLYFCFRPNKEMVDSKYLQFFFDTKLWHKHIAEIAVEGARNHGLLNMSVGSFYSMPILLPNMQDQRAIAEKLSVFQQKRAVEEALLNSLLTQKRFLLESLFV